MTASLLLLVLLPAVGGVLFGLYHWRRARRQADRLDRMLSRAIDGSFLEESFDETLPSALETRLARFLNGSAASARALDEERRQIAALIADISHQTRTPIANLLLYASLLEESPLSPAQQGQLCALRGQAEKLAFLMEALVKSSRLDAGVLTLSRPSTPSSLCWRTRPPRARRPPRKRGSLSPSCPVPAPPALTPSGRRRPCSTWLTTP